MGTRASQRASVDPGRLSPVLSRAGRTGHMAEGGGTRATAIRALQRAIGNRAVGRLFQSGADAAPASAVGARAPAGSPVIRRAFDSWGWSVPSPTSTQVDEAEAEVETAMGWTPRSTLLVKDLAATVAHVPTNFATHATMLKADIRSKVEAAIQAAAQPATEAAARKKAVRALRTANYHVTVEWFAADHADNPKWYRNTATWEKKPAGFVEADAAGSVTEAQTEVAAIDG